MTRPPPIPPLFPYTTLSRSVKTDQANRPQVLDMFEPQDHPVEYPAGGGPPIPPYRGDGSGWTAAFQIDRKSTRLNSSHMSISYAVFCLKKKKRNYYTSIVHL